VKTGHRSNKKNRFFETNCLKESIQESGFPSLQHMRPVL